MKIQPSKKPRSSTPAHAAARTPKPEPGASRPIDPARLLVRDVMCSDVLVLQADDPIKSAAEQLEDFRASGAPVVDAAGRLVGVLTTTDIARSEHVGRRGIEATTESRTVEALAEMIDAGADEELLAGDGLETRVAGGLCVADWMTPRVVEVTPQTTVADACRTMLDEAIHRVFVVDGHRLVGVLSTEDVVRLLATPGGRAAHRAGRTANGSRRPRKAR